MGKPGFHEPERRASARNPKVTPTGFTFGEKIFQ
jgi:hypothetical protein